MEDEKGGGSASKTVHDGSGAPSSSFSSAKAEPCEVPLQRQRFTVELRPGETTIVSWKRLIKEADKTNVLPSIPGPPTGAQSGLQSVLPPEQPIDTELKDAGPPPNRFSAVIEKIERLYMGKASSDEEELDDVPDDDQYDTEDSFIDDAELNEYFEVDKLTTKHNGFFVNRGTLEKINEPISSPSHEPKKRKRRDVVSRSHREKDSDQMPRKSIKASNVKMKDAARSGSHYETKILNVGQVSIHPNEYHHEGNPRQNQLNMSAGLPKVKVPDFNIKSNSVSEKILKRETSSFPVDMERPKAGVSQVRDTPSKVKVSIEGVQQVIRERINTSKLEKPSKKFLKDDNEADVAKFKNKENAVGDQLDLSSSISKYSNQIMKSHCTLGKEASALKSKGTLLERAIRELEKLVSESRPQSMDIHDPDPTSQNIKKRLPQDVKLKLAKVARLASSQGRLSEDLVNRLMGILGHLVQLKTLKRNLKEMIESGLSAKQQKDDRCQQIKREVIEMIRMRTSSLNSKASGQEGSSNDFQEKPSSEEKDPYQGKFNMDKSLEDKICELYDLYIEGMDEDKGPQLRKLYVELAELWPNGSMDNLGIKTALHRARARRRRRALYSRQKDEERIRKKVTEEEFVKEEIKSVQERLLLSDSSGQVFTSPDRMPIANQTTSGQLSLSLGRSLNLPMNGSVPNCSMQDKIRIGTNMVGVNTTRNVAIKKKLKRKHETDMGEFHVQSVKLQSHHVKDRPKPPKKPSIPPSKSVLETISHPQQPSSNSLDGVQI